MSKVAAYVQKYDVVAQESLSFLNKTVVVPLGQRHEIASIEALDAQLHESYRGTFVTDPFLTRSVVSFQDSKTRPIYRWYKYKEAFSPTLVMYLLRENGIRGGRLLDPFAGSGTTLFAASETGLHADGIELLPIGREIMQVRLCVENGFQDADLDALERWVGAEPWKTARSRCAFNELRITSGAYSPESVDSIQRYLGAIGDVNPRLRQVLFFALLCILESISFTRKDGQYLRWDSRSGRNPKSKPFDKGPIPDFDMAIRAKLKEIINDTNRDPGLFGDPADGHGPGRIRLYSGSCLHVLQTLQSASYDAVMTSPPYCNRYDYTRTYALELAMLGFGETQMAELRQQMLSCTVENHAKDLLSINPRWADAIAATDRQELLQSVLAYLERQKAERRLNNAGIPRMVRGYFYEMACVVQECARLLRDGARLFMVNDNVRYAGVSVSVDLILSSIAKDLGFHIERISVLPQGKGNSSQQMGEHGRTPLRKCVYVWRKA